MDKTISISALVVATAAAVASIMPDTSKYVAKSADEDTVAVTSVVQQSGVKPVSCCKDWIILGDETNQPELRWVCSDTGYDPSRTAWLDKKGKDAQCVEFNPSVDKDDNVEVELTLREGTPRPQPPTIAELTAEPIQPEGAKK